MQKKNRGGFRAGAGRPSTGVHKNAFATRLKPSTIDRLKAYAEKKSMNIGDALDEILSKIEV